MNIDSRNLGAGQILCLADSFDAILRQLAPDYFARAYSSVQSVLDELGVAPELRVGWMHPGYACLAPGVEVPSLEEPGGLFGWITQSPDLDAFGDRDLMCRIASCGSRQSPPVQWASCSSRSYAFAGTSEASWARVLDLFAEFALDDRTEWAGPFVVPDRTVPVEAWRQLVLAAATDDTELEQQAWSSARNLYTDSALELLARGVNNTRQCNNW